MSTSLALVTGTAFGVTAAAVPACIVVSRRTGIVDRPGPLKLHQDPVPYLGGAAVFAGLVVAGLAGRPLALVPMAAALGVGVADDRFDLDPKLRLVAQLGMGAVIAAVQPVHLPGLVGVPLVIAVTVVLINGVNLLDGLDMLAGGVVAVAAIGFAVLVHGPDRPVAAALAAALAAFLLYNRPPARIYLGDGGSYLLGASMSLLLAMTWAPGVRGPIGVAAMALVAVPVAELACAIVRRHRAGRSLLSGDRGHPYDRLVERGWPRIAASGAYVGAEAAVVVVVVVVAPRASFVVALVLDVVAAVALLGACALAGGMDADAGGGA